MAQNSSKFIILGENPGLDTFAEKLSNEALGAQASVIRWDRGCVKTKDQFEEQMKMYWYGCLVIGLLDAIREKGWVEAIGEEYLNSETQKFFGSFDMVMTPEAWIHEIQTNIEKYSLLVDKIDEVLEKKNDWVYVFYTDLDIFSKYPQYIESLLQYWQTQYHRLTRICPRIFLPKQLYRPDKLLYQDASKLNGYIVRLP